MDGDEHPPSRPHTIPILRSSDLFLTISNHTGLDQHRRFADLFRGTWRAIPLHHRRLLRHHWRTDPYRPAGASPRIALEPPMSGWGHRFIRPRPLRHVIGICTGHGHELLFHPAVMEKMPDVHVQELIAHELGHVYLHAIGDTSRGAVCEIRTDKVMKHWGFHPHEGTNWYHRNVKGWWAKGGPIWRKDPTSDHELGIKLWEPAMPNWCLRYLKSDGRLAWDDWQVPPGTPTRRTVRLRDAVAG